MNTLNTPPARRADLDALRAVAMLLGIGLHAALSFFPAFWIVNDTRQSAGLGVFVSAIHGFRMPVFFVMSGFFSAMLLDRRGAGGLVKQRFRRVFLPLLLGLGTIIPLTNWVSGVAMSDAMAHAAAPTEAEESTIWAAAEAGDVAAIERHLADGVAIDASGGEPAVSALHHAALSNRPEVIEMLIDRGADVEARAGDGGTPLHAAAFVGSREAVEALVKRGADVNAANDRGATPLDNAVVDESATLYFSAMLKLPVDKDDLGARKAAIADLLREQGATAGQQASAGDLLTLLMQWPMLNHLWFLWFLWWLVLGLAAVSAIGSRLPAWRLPSGLVMSPARYLWLVPLTMLPQWFMGAEGSPMFGPDTSAGLVPIPHVLAYYAIFFGFGAIYYRHDRGNTSTDRWWLPLGIGLLVVLPLGMALTGIWPGLEGAIATGLSPEVRRGLTVAVAAAYPWLLTFGLMGLFRRFCSAENPRMRYLSDSAYWLYLAHLPLVIGGQYLVRDWPLPALVKFGLIVVVVTALLLVSYRYLVRYTWLGRFLNGPRERPVPVAEPVLVA